MTGVCRWILVLAALLTGGAKLFGASAEEKSFTAAARNFQDGLWEAAADGFSDFVRDHPESQRVAEAILFQAKATITNGQFTAGIELLSKNEFRAGAWRDQYLFWIGQAHLRNANYAAAADVFERLLANFPASARRFDSALGAALAHSKLGQWPRVIEMLQDTTGEFQQAAQAGVINEGIPSGYLLLGEAHLAQTNYSGVEATLRLLDARKLRPELAWQRYALQCRMELSAGFPEAALQTTTNLTALAAAANSRRLQAETTALEAGIQERLNSLEAAISNWQRNLATNTPVDLQCRALLKIAELSLALDKPAETVRMLERYVDQQPPAGAVDLALLTIGELQLKQYLADSETNHPGILTNLLAEASGRFDRVLNDYTNSPWTGKALLDKGWSLWMHGRYAQSEGFFRRAAERLPASGDQAVARFKWADAQFMQTNFAGAVTNYQFVVSHYVSWPEIQPQLLERALYQTVRAAVEVTNLPVASDALDKILDWYPDGFAGDRCLLLVGQGFLQQNDPARARELFGRFEELYPSSPRLPELRLAAARTYELEGHWTAALTNYEAWIATFTNSPQLLPQAEYCLANSTAMAGMETNALTRLTNFVARFRSNIELAPRAQYSVGLYYWSHPESMYEAERNFQILFRTWPSSELACPAELMAGRAAMARGSYKDAVDYFAQLYTNVSCPAELKIDAAIRAGTACMSWADVGEATNRLARLEDALDWFEAVTRSFPTNAQAPAAWMRIGDCHLQWAALDPQKYLAASNAYQQVLAFSNAPALARGLAKLALATVAEKTGDDQAALRQCLEVLNGSFNGENEEPDPFLVKEAGLRAGRLAQKLQLWLQAANIYTKLATLLPAKRAEFEERAAQARKHIDQPG